jgi:hypothetical protein
MRSRTLRLATIAWLWASPTSAADGNHIIRICSSNVEHLQGYVSGLIEKADADGSIVLGQPAPNLDIGKTEERTKEYVRFLGVIVKQIEGYCIPQGAVLNQASEIFCKYLQDNPAQRHKPGHVLFRDALLAAWPCPK